MKSDFGQVCHADGGVVAAQVRRPRSFLARARGLLGSSPLGVQEGLWLDRCDSIHMFGMHYAIDVVFLRDGEVSRLCADVLPFRARWCPGANTALELARGSIERLGLRVTDQLQFRSRS